MGWPSVKTLKIGSIEIPLRSALDCATAYEQIGGETILRTINGSGIRQETWKKLRATVSGSGWIPPGLDAVDSTQQQVVAFAAPLAVTCDGSRQATLPAGRRSDSGYTPWAIALLADGGIIDTPVAVVGDTATADAVADAIGYQAWYYPQITAWVSRPSQSLEHQTATWSWELFVEQV
jgi:hypothetical protein